MPMIALLNPSVSARSYSSGMCNRNVVRIGRIASLSHKSLKGFIGFSFSRGSCEMWSMCGLRSCFSCGLSCALLCALATKAPAPIAPEPTANEFKSPPCPCCVSYASTRRRCRSFSNCSIKSCSAEQVCNDVTITALNSCMTKNAPQTTTNAYHTSTGHPRPSISK